MSWNVLELEGRHEKKREENIEQNKGPHRT
jgi:hypothetical protein